MIDGPNSRLLWCLLAGITCVYTAHCISMPFLALYLTHQTACSLWVSGLTIGVAPLFSILGGFLGGYLSDKHGRLLLVHISIFTAACILFLFYGAFTFTYGYKQWVLIICLNALFGLFTSLFQPSVMALLTDWVDTSYRARVFQFRYAAINLGGILGPMLGVYAGVTESSLAFLIGGFIHLIYGILLFLVLNKEKPRAVRQEKNYIYMRDILNQVWMDKRLCHFLGFHIIFALCYSQITSTLPIYITHNLIKGSEVYSYVIMLNALGVLLGQKPIFLLCKHIARTQMMFYGCILFCFGCFGFAYSGQEKIYFYLSTFFITLGELMVFPSASEVLDNMAPLHLKGTYFGALTFRELGLALGPIFGSVVLHIFGGPILFILTGLLSIGSHCFIRLHRQAHHIYHFQHQLTKS